MATNADGFTRLDPNVVKLWTRQLMLGVAPFVLAAIIAVAATALADGPTAGVLAGCLLVLVPTIALAVWFPRRRYGLWGYRLDDVAIEIVHGSVIRRRSVIPYFRVQHLDTSRGPLERMLKLATLEIHTASSGTDATIPGLNDDVANELRAAVVSRAGITAGV